MRVRNYRIRNNQILPKQNTVVHVDNQFGFRREYSLLKQWLLSFTICLFLIFPVQGQNLKFQPISTELGLSQNFVSDIAEDSTGFIWVATPSGLNRFDGYAYKLFKNDPNDSLSLGSNSVLKLLVDQNKSMWVAHAAGVQIFNPANGQFIQVSLPKSLSVRHLVEDKDGLIWVIDSERTVHSIKRNGLNQFDIKTYRTLIPNNDLKDDIIRSIAMDGQNRLWINGGSFLGVIDFKAPNPKMDHVNWASFRQRPHMALTEALSDEPFFDDKLMQGLVMGKDGQIFLYDNLVLTIVENNQTESFSVKELENGDEVNFVKTRYYGHHDKKGILWLHSSAANAHLVVDIEAKAILPGNLKIFENISAGITCLIETANGNYWAGTNGNGIYKGISHKEIFDSPPASTKVVTSSTYPVYKDEDDNVWFCTLRDIWVIPKGSQKPEKIDYPIDHHYYVRSKESNFEFSAKSISGDGNGGLWVGNYDGLHHFKKDGIEILDQRFYPIKQRSRNGNDDFLLGVYDIVTDELGDTYISTAGEFGKFDPETGSFEGNPFEVDFGTYDDNRFTNKIIQTDERTFWIGTLYGLVKFDKKNANFKYFRNDPKNPNTIASNSIKTILLDPINPTVIWVGTNGNGLDRFDTKTEKFTHYTLKEGLPDETIYGILNNGKKELWLSTNKGLCSFDLKSETIKTYSASDGLQDNEFNTRSFYKASDNEMIFGGIHGFNRFYPNQLFQSDFNPNTSITGLKINNEPVTFDSQSEVLSNPIEAATEIFVAPDVKMVAFDISGLDLSAPEKTIYQYQLENYDDSWNTIGKSRNITFTNLPYGDFNLRVRCTNRSGIWSDKIHELSIHMLSPWWQKWWAYAAYVLLLLLIVLAIYRFQLKRENDRREARRLLELDTLKSRLFTNITHEFRTPITVILGMTGMIEGQEKYTRTISKNADSLLQMVNQILDLSKLESNKLDVNYINGNILEYLRYLTESLRGTASQQDKQLIFKSSSDTITMDYDEMKTRHILYNLLSNALKFTSPGDQIEVRLSEVKDKVLLVEVEDTGIGISQDKIPHVFNRFYQVDDSSTRQAQGTGIGLALCFELVKLLGGEINVESTLGVGSTFSFNLPIRNESAQGSYTPLPEIISSENEVSEFGEVNTSKSEEKPLLLLIEDSFEIVRFIEMLLEGTYTIVHAENGQRGIDEAISIIPDIIISDVMMPFKNGYEVTEVLKSDIRTSHVPIILLTAKSTQADRNLGLEKGADAYLHKPFDRAELQIRLKKLIELRKMLINKFKGLEESPEKSDYLENQFLVHVKSVIIENLRVTDFKVEDLENALKLSRMQLYRKLKALTGMSPSLVIRDMRLNQAAELLRKSELNVSEVAYEVGFNDPSYFTRAFKEKFGTSPSKYK